MEISKYQAEASRTMSQCENPLIDSLHMILGMQTEVAEIADVYKKHIASRKELDLVNIKEELGDTMFYIANMCNLHGWDLRDILQTNIDKLKTRYPDKFTNELAINRNLDAERLVLENAVTKFEKGKFYSPFEDYIMDDGGIAFIKNFTYKCLKKDTLESELFGNHNMKGEEHLFKQV